MRSFFRKIISFFTPEYFSEIFYKQATWKLKYTDSKESERFDAGCAFIILKSNKGRYRLDVSGYKPKEHPMYVEMFKLYRCLVEGTHYISGGEVFQKFEALSLEECNEQLKEALANENYELANRLKQIIEQRKK